MAKFITYKNLDTIPVYNYFKLVSTSDLRYLICDVNLNNLPEIKDYTELRKAYESLSRNVDNVNMTLQFKYIQYLQLFLKYIKGEVDLQTIDNKFNDYCKELDNNYKNYQYDNLVFESALQLRNHLSVNKTSLEDYLMTRYVILDYNKIVAEELSNWSLYDDIANIKNIMKIDIDEFKCSMSKFIHFKKLAIEKAKKINNSKKD